jgi:predicted N-acyltransferase
MSIRYNLEVFNTVDDIGKGSIDGISNDPFFTYGWFKTLEEQEDFRISPFYITAYKQGKLVAFTPCFVDLFDHYLSYGPAVVPFMKRFLKSGTGLGHWKKHVLLCYSPFCFRSKIIADKTLRNPIIFALIYQKINEICKKERILFSSFLFVSELDSLLTKTLQKFGYIRFPWLNTLSLDIRWSSFKAFLEGCKYKIRKEIRREIRKFDQSGLILERNSNIEELSERLSVLYANLFRKYNGEKPSPFGSSFFRSLSRFAGDQIELFTAENSNETVAFSLVFRHKDTADAFMFGTDYPLRDSTDFAYFNLAYYEPIKWAIQEGIRKIRYRLAAENVKLRIGCKPEKNSSYVKCHNPLITSFIRAYVNKKYAIQT